MLSTTTDTPLQTILLVEDDEPLANNIAEELSFNGFTVITADSVREAVRRIRDANDIKVIILDYDLSESRNWPNGENGIELLHIFRDHTPQLYNLSTFPPVIAHSSDSGWNKQLLNAGAQTAVKKSGNKETLIMAINKIIQEQKATV